MTKPCLAILASLVWLPLAPGAEPLHQRIDALIAARAHGKKASPLTDDAEFLRRIYLDLAGRVPSLAEARAFLAEQAPNRRERLIDKLLASPDYPRRMQELFHVMFMERLGDNPEWSNYLQTSFAANKPWDQMAREILRADPRNEAARGASFFYSKRLEHYGENPVDYPALTRDVGRLFLGIDLQCAQCHDHRFIKDYKQSDFQGLFAFFQNTALADAKRPAINEKLMTRKVAFQSVFNKVPKETGPRIPGAQEIAIPTVKKGEEFLVPPDPKKKVPGIPRFSPLEQLAVNLPRAENPLFVRNSVNRFWFVLMGRGLVHPLDLQHNGNPPAYPDVLDLLAKEFVAHKFDSRWLIRELTLTQTYQRSSMLPEGGAAPSPESFLTGLEKRLSAEQLLVSIFEATGAGSAADLSGKTTQLDKVRPRFVKAFANPARDPEEEFNPSLKAALFMLNDETVVGWLQPRPGNLVDRLDHLNDAGKSAEELYLAVLTRLPTPQERTEIKDHLTKHAKNRPAGLRHLVWALLASTEFCVNH